MQRLLRRPREDTTLMPPAPEPPAPRESSPPSAPEARGTVEVICGALTGAVAVAGMTAADVRALLAAPFNVAPRANMLVNGRPVSSRYRLGAGEVVEFVSPTGEKG